VEFLQSLRSHAVVLPNLAKFAFGMLLIVGVPPLCRKIRLPAVVGLVLTGTILGPHAIGLFGESHPIAAFLADLGKLLMMFVAGVEIDLARFRQAEGRSIAFGILTTSIPLLLGTTVGFLFGYSATSAIVIGSLLASHTLLASPIVTKLGANRLESITVTIGATVMSDTLSLVVFAICVSTYVSGFSAFRLILQIVEIAVLVPVILFGLGRIGAYLLKRAENAEDAYFVLLFGMLAVAGLLAQLVNLPGIVGAFLAGLAVNAAVHSKPGKDKLEFFANSFFVPIFFVVTGFLISPTLFVHSILDNFLLVVGIISALVVGKFIAAYAAGHAFGYPLIHRLTMWSLTLPQVAATLAAALVAFNTVNQEGQRLLDRSLLNVVFVLMLTTSILGPILTERLTPRMLEAERMEKSDPARGAGGSRSTR
jgi:Kef-type K+ transport system membrane component KefB